MSTGKLVLVCKKTGAQLPIEQLRRHGYDFKIVHLVTVKPYFLPYKADQVPPVCPPGTPPAEVDAFYDDLIGGVIAECRDSGAKQSVEPDLGGKEF